MQEKIKNIESYLLSSANEKSLAKGRRIAQTIDNFGSPSIDVENNKAVFRIMGTYFYTVTITNFLGTISSSCTCAYDWGGICKHQVAGLYYLINFLKNGSGDLPHLQPRQAAFRSINERKASDPYLIESYRPLNYDVLLRNTDFYYVQATSNFVISDFELQGQTVEFRLKEGKTYWNKIPKQYRVSFSKNGKGLQTVCSCGDFVTRLCKHQIATLGHLIQDFGPDFFAVLEPGYLTSRRQELASTTGIPVEQLEEYYEFDLKTQQFIAKPKAKGLVHFNTYSENRPEELLAALSEREHFLISEPILEDQKALEMGYVFSFKEALRLEIIPITGTPSDTVWMKYMKPYTTDNKAMRMNRADEELIAILVEMEKTREDTWHHPSKLLGPKDINFQKFYFKKLSRIFELLQEKKYVYYRSADHSGVIKKSHLQPVQLSGEKVEVFFELGEEELFYFLKAKLHIGDQIIDLADPALDLHSIFPFFSLVLWEGVLYRQPSLDQASTLFELGRQSPVLKVVKKDFPQFFEKIVTPVAKIFPVKNNIMKGFDQKDITLLPQEKRLYISELANFIIFKPIVTYDHDQVVNARLDNNLIKVEDSTIINYHRDKDFEQGFIDFVSGLHPEFQEQRFGEFYFLPFTELTQNNWFFNIFEQIAGEQINVFGINELKSIQYSPYKAKVNTSIRSGEDWFDVQIELSFGEEQVKLADLRKAIMRNEQFVKLGSGKIGMLPDHWFKKLQRFFRVAELKKGDLKISKLKFSVIDDLFDQIDDAAVLQELREKKQKLRTFKSIKKTNIPAEITADLRVYQREGFNWLNFLDEFQWGGILADDMGLGKTLQILCFLQLQSNRSRKCNLVVVPTSLLFNWENEIGKFAPQLRYLIHHGPDRTSRVRDFEHYDLIITTYGLVTNDIELLTKYEFNYIVLDESQAIKNPHSKRYRAVCLLNGKNRLALTGTPIENNTFDLYAQLNFLNPGFLGSQQSFKSEFSKPIDGEGQEDRAEELQKLIKPFVLRRTKEQVAKELPPKVEDYIYCTMEEEQRKVYDAYRNQYRDYLMNKIQEEGLQRSKLHVLEGLLRLRQICDSPQLLPGDEEYTSQSIKVKELIKHITEKTGKHKILVFSQFVKMLRIIENKLQKHQIKYEYLDGQCSPAARQKSIEVFQENDDYRVFLISLKAGGTGLNLTAADYVYIVDPWWNPAVENQAIDRTHRIGQDKHVIAYRMICKDTVEEKILNLQKKKLKVASDIIHTDESLMKSLTQEDIMDLFG